MPATVAATRDELEVDKLNREQEKRGPGIPNRVDNWGPDWDHDWPTWRAMLPQYLDELT